MDFGFKLLVFLNSATATLAAVQGDFKWVLFFGISALAALYMVFEEDMRKWVRQLFY